MDIHGNHVTHGSWQGWLKKGLTLRELQAVLGLANGEAQKEIARDMSINPSSVNKLCQNAYYRLGVRKPAGAVAEAFKRGIIAPMLVILSVVTSTCPNDLDIRYRTGRPTRVSTLRARGSRSRDLWFDFDSNTIRTV